MHRFHYCMFDGSVACLASVLISLATRKSKYEINALMKKASIILEQEM